ncbi:MAG TPA: cupin domain-containing protein [Methylotenera sp.]|nr:cupin domain-containing protein [Methylotenera sp.]HPV45367.1 cupin domain-containing protein [Methylotenera sp.]
MNQIIVEHNPGQTRLEAMGVNKWPTWQKEVSVFDWTFPEQEIAYILEGECVITPKDGTPTGGAAVTFGKGDLVTFPAGMTVSWEVKKPLHKHYQLDGTLIGRIYRRVKLALKL